MLLLVLIVLPVEFRGKQIIPNMFSELPNNKYQNESITALVNSSIAATVTHIAAATATVAAAAAAAPGHNVVGVSTVTRDRIFYGKIGPKNFFSAALRLHKCFKCGPLGHIFA